MSDGKWVLALVLVTPLSVADPASLIGRELPPLPAGCIHKESGLLYDLDKFAYERMLCGRQEVVVLERFVERRGKLAYWKVLDELLLPPAERGYAALDVPLCESATYPESAVLAVGVWDKAENGVLVAKNISHAWRFNLDAVRIEPISTHEVVCESEYQH